MPNKHIDFVDDPADASCGLAVVLVTLRLVHVKELEGVKGKPVNQNACHS